jgi:hypothetical protein
MSDQQKDDRPGRCTGPRTRNGKENSSRNSATHGLSCETFFLVSGETKEAFQAHVQMWADEYSDVASPLLGGLIEDVVQAHWLVKRACRRMFESESALDNTEVNRQSGESADEIFRRLQLIQRYKARHEASYQRAFRAIESFRKSRLAEPLAAARLENVRYSNVDAQVRTYHRLTDFCGDTYEEAWEKIHYLFALQKPTAAPTESGTVSNRPDLHL